MEMRKVHSNCCNKWNNKDSNLLQVIGTFDRSITFSRSSVIAAYGQRGNATRALELFQQMLDRGVKADLISWYCIGTLNNWERTAVISAFSQVGRSKKALELLHQMQSEGFIPDHITWYLTFNFF